MMGPLKNWLKRLANFLKRFAAKIFETLSDILESIVSAILSFLRKAVGFVTFMGLGCFCCRLYCAMVNAKTTKIKNKTTV